MKTKNPPPRKPEFQIIRTKIHGVTFPNPDGSNRQRIIRRYCRQGLLLEVRPEPKNRYDRNALGLWVMSRRFFVFPVWHQVGGFDLLPQQVVHGSTGIEVRGRARIDDVEPRENERAKACNERSRDWLCVVDDRGTAHPRIMRVQEPFGMLS